MAQGIGFKSNLFVNVDSTGSGFASGSGSWLGGVVDGWETEEETEMVDITVLSMSRKAALPADTDPGDVSFEYALDPSDSAYTELVTARDNGYPVQITEVLSNGIIDVNTGYVKTIGKTVKKRSNLTSKVTIKKTEVV